MRKSESQGSFTGERWRRLSCKLAEGEGFEPPKGLRPGGFQVERTRRHYRLLLVATGRQTAPFSSRPITFLSIGGDVRRWFCESSARVIMFCGRRLESPPRPQRCWPPAPRAGPRGMPERPPYIALRARRRTFGDEPLPP